MPKMYCERCVYGSGFHAGFCPHRGKIRIYEVDFMGSTITMVEDPSLKWNEVLFINLDLFNRVLPCVLRNVENP